MENTSGFYKWIDGQWYWGPNMVVHPEYTLLKEVKDTYEYPVDGWSWYDERPSDPETI
jgi:hypothetical protein